MKNIVVIGGGTAGWLAALYSKKNFPEHNVILIESSKVGILGAGESTTPPIVKMLEDLNIPVSLLVKETKATIKNTIKFTNWSSEKYYYNSFAFKNNYLNQNNLNSYISEDWNGVSAHNIISTKMNENITEADFIGNLSEKGMTLMRVDDFTNRQTGTSDNLHADAFYALHVDARRLASLFSRIGKERGIKHIDAFINNFAVDENSNIKEIILDDGQIVKSDFIFDCSGFARLVIGKLYKSKWKSFSHILPMKKAIPFFVEIEDEKQIVPYSESIALNYGWMWRVPLQHRFGCGYVFDSDRISLDDAKKEVEEFVGHEINPPKIFDFNPGSFEEIWINNCIALGLSAGFIEPLEATALLQFQETIEALFKNKDKIFSNDKEYKNKFNKKYNDQIDSTIDFVYLHYITDKTNNDFWLNFTKNNPMPKSLKEKLYYLNNDMLFQDVAGHNGTDMFDVENYYIVSRGTKQLNINNINKHYDKYNLKNALNDWNSQKTIRDEHSSSYMSHIDVLKFWGGLS